MPAKLLLTLAATLALACASAPAADPAPAPEPQPIAEPNREPAPPTCPNEPGLCFEVEPADAQLVVDGESKGSLSELAPTGPYFLDLESGIYQIMLRREGYTTWRGEVSVREASEKIKVTLEAK